MQTKDAPRPLYEQLAHDIASRIDRGALRAGDRLPSVRRMSTQRGVSVSTVLSAYEALEDRGLIETRNRSGHYVRTRRASSMPPPRMPRRVAAPAKVSVDWALTQLMTSGHDPALVPLGCAFPSPELLPIRKLNRLLAAALRESTAAGGLYDSAAGWEVLRRQLARRSIDWDVVLDADDLVTTTGATEALNLGLRSVARAGDAIAVESPTFFGILQLIESLGMRAVEIPVHPERGMDLDALEEVLQTTPIAAVIASPNFTNPSGAIMSDEAKERLVRMTGRRGVTLIEDDVYGELPHEGDRPRPAKAFDRDGHVMLCGSISKTAAPGFRVGWIAPGCHRETVLKLKFTSTIATPIPTQMAVAELLESGGFDRHLRRMRGRLRHQVACLREGVATHFPAGTRVSSPSGGFIVWVELPTGTDGLTLNARARDEGISIAPGPVFSARHRFTNFIRLSAGYPWCERIEKAVVRLGELAEEVRAGEPARRSA